MSPSSSIVSDCLLHGRRVLKADEMLRGATVAGCGGDITFHLHPSSEHLGHAADER